MLRHYEKRSARYIVPRGTFHAGYVGTRKKPSAESGAAGTDYSDGCRRYAEPRDRSPFGYQQANGTALAATLFGFSTGGVAKGCSPRVGSGLVIIHLIPAPPVSLPGL